MSDRFLWSIAVADLRIIAGFTVANVYSMLSFLSKEIFPDMTVTEDIH